MEFLDNPEGHPGSKCIRDGVEGVCTSIYTCLTAVQDVKDKKYPPLCRYQGDTPIICCTDCELVNDTRTMYISQTSGRWYFRNGQKARDKCLDYMQELEPCGDHFTATIAKDLDPERKCYIPRPTAALLGYGLDEDSAQWVCAGSLISENFVLTAGHCISSPSLGEVKYVALGILKRSDPSDIWQIYHVKRIIAHPDYNPPSKYNDIALLETQTRVVFSDVVRPACLHFEEIENDNNAEATGWGALGLRKGLADTLQSVYLQEFPEDECSKLYPLHRLLRRGYDHRTQMCYGHHEEVKDTCEGDSGGPLQNTFHISSCQYMVIGVTSTGRQCGLLGSTGLYTRVFSYLHWIESIVWP
ncbi:hypothetical protein HW555_009471 [Spodoptera exigua]|uniref:Peptidase S1 domain-containing protein n=1 Tax=Spodoptera exigua TaxID=7107 RepID=A0A835GB60_SPOEX|nr:hypothetical protein HW555_009471 [Spodoptera exigua]